MDMSNEEQITRWREYSALITTAPMIMASIAKLGFDIKDVRVLLNSEPHADHAGGLGCSSVGRVRRKAEVKRRFKSQPTS